MSSAIMAAILSRGRLVKEPKKWAIIALDTGLSVFGTKP